jgi:predicted DNA-binding protein (UPF0251 family)
LTVDSTSIILAEIAALRAEVRALRVAAVPTPKLLSFRQAARRLGINRGTTLRALIERGLIHTVAAKARRKIPVAEIERLERDGYDLDQPISKKRRRSSPQIDAVDEAAKIRALPY